MLYGAALGLLFGYAFFIRPNDAVAIAGGLTAGVVGWMVWHKRWRQALLLSAGWCIGVVVVAVPIVAYFAAHHVLPQFWYGLVGVNIAYTGGAGMLGSLVTHTKMELMLLVLCQWVVLWCSRPARRLLLGVVPAEALLVLLMGGSCFCHYYLVLLPLLAAFFAAMPSSPKPVTLLAVGILFLSMQTMNRAPVPRMARKVFTQRLHPMREKGWQELDIVLKGSEPVFATVPVPERDSVWNYNCGAGENYGSIAVFHHNGVVPCSPTLYDFEYNKGIPTRYGQRLMEVHPLPLWVFVIHDVSDLITSDSLFTAHYELRASNELGHQMYRRR